MTPEEQIEQLQSELAEREAKMTELAEQAKVGLLAKQKLDAYSARFQAINTADPALAQKMARAIQNADAPAAAPAVSAPQAPAAEGNFDDHDRELMSTMLGQISQLITQSNSNLREELISPLRQDMELLKQERRQAEFQSKPYHERSQTVTAEIESMAQDPKYAGLSRDELHRLVDYTNVHTELQAATQEGADEARRQSLLSQAQGVGGIGLGSQTPVIDTTNMSFDDMFAAAVSL